MDAKTYVFQSDFARDCIAQGFAEASAHARVLVTRQLTYRFDPLDAQAQALIQCTSFADLGAIGERLLTAHTLQDALGFATMG